MDAKSLAGLIVDALVDALVDANLIPKEQFDKAVEIAEEEISVREALGNIVFVHPSLRKKNI